MLSDFCPKHGTARALCGCLIVALGIPTVASLWKGDPQAKLPPVHVVGSNLTGGPTGTVQMSSGSGVIIVADATIPGQRYVSVWPDQPRKAVLGPTGAANDSRRPNVASVTGATGPSDGNRGSELSKGPTGARG
jgi:hypothetical protein